MRYRRISVPGGCYFFTVVTAQRRAIFTSPQAIQLLRQAMIEVKSKRPFTIDAMVVLPDHLHCLWTLPPNDADYSTRWRLIKTWFSKHFLQAESHGPFSVWQNRYWEHLIRDDKDWRLHMDYIHYNPVKHGCVARPVDWPYSSFASCVRKGWYEVSWGSDVGAAVLGMERE